MKKYLRFLPVLMMVFVFMSVTTLAVVDVPTVQAGDFRIDISPLPKTKADPTRIQNMLRIVFMIIGALSLLMVTVGGFKYVASQGDPQAAARAKGTILFAIVGLLISMLAVAIVTFVISKVG